MPGATDDLLASFARTTDEIVTLEELKTKLRSGRKLRIKYGVDVTAPFLHIGHAVNLWMMREMQEAGHVVIFLIGDFTTRVGDPTGRSESRPVIPAAEIEANAAAFIDQVAAVLRTDPGVFEIRRNSEWWESMTVGELMPLLSLVTHGRLVSRDMFQRRIAEGAEIHMHEFLYPVLQGYDSYMLGSDLTIVGTDQLFNEMMGRHYQSRLGQDPQVVITTRITPGIDGGEKQSKSIGNYIALAHSPRDKFGRAMSIPDHLIVPYLEVYTAVPTPRVEEVRAGLEDRSLHPMEAKRFLARELVARYHGEQVARAEDEWFTGTFSRHELPRNVPVVTVGEDATLFDVLVAGLAGTSRNEIRRLLAAGSISVDGERALAGDEVPREGAIVRVGKRRFLEVRHRAATDLPG
ncbi:MAG TPA: tyrosine--tRNA ligase [Acidimicrobiales bacterium]|nr:tyrosine--tRNA ligase [Acidimicrobiales bacterium]